MQSEIQIQILAFVNCQLCAKYCVQLRARADKREETQQHRSISIPSFLLEHSLLIPVLYWTESKPHLTAYNILFLDSKMPELEGPQRRTT